MQILEYQVRERFEQYSIPVVPGKLVSTPQEVYDVATDYGKTVLLKPQLLNYLEFAVHSPKEAQSKTSEILDTYPDAQFLVVPHPDFEKTLSLSISLDRAIQKPVLNVRDHKQGLAASEHIEPLLGLRTYQVTNVAGDVNLSREYWPAFTHIARSLYQCYRESDATHVEITPLVIVNREFFVALGAWMSVDDNALYRQRFVDLPSAYSTIETSAYKAGIRFVQYDGQIGCLVNGAGLGMTVHDLIHQYGDGRVTPANFLDICGSISEEKVQLACRLLLQETQIQVLLVVVFAGITRCDDVARALVNVFEENACDLPVVLRFQGTHADVATEIAQSANYPNFHLEPDLVGAIRKAVQLVQEQS